MTDKHTNLPANYDDLELVTRYVQGKLDHRKNLHQIAAARGSVVACRGKV